MDKQVGQYSGNGRFIIIPGKKTTMKSTLKSVGFVGIDGFVFLHNTGIML